MKLGQSGSCDLVASAVDFDDSVRVVRTEQIYPCPRTGPSIASHIYSGRAGDHPQGSSNAVSYLPCSSTTAA